MMKLWHIKRFILLLISVFMMTMKSFMEPYHFKKQSYTTEKYFIGNNLPNEKLNYSSDFKSRVIIRDNFNHTKIANKSTESVHSLSQCGYDVSFFFLKLLLKIVCVLDGIFYFEINSVLLYTIASNICPVKNIS